MLNQILQDLRFAFRQMRRTPGFTLVAVLTLALGIGSATAVFSVIDAALLRALPYAHQDRLIFPDTHARSGYQQPWSWLSFVDARGQLKSFAGLAGYGFPGRINLESPSAGPISLPVVKSTDNLFDVLGVAPVLGRTFRAGEDRPGQDNVAVLSYEVWKTAFGGDPGVVGRVARLDGMPYTILGVMPAGFRFPISTRGAIYTPIHADPTWIAQRGSHWMRSVGLLRPGVSMAQAQLEFQQVLGNLARAYPGTDAGRSVQLMPLQKAMTGSASAPLAILLLAVLALLAIACVNVAALLLARGIKREREMALRAALGADRPRLIRQMLAESLLLATAGLVGGIVLSYILLALMRGFMTDGLFAGVDVRVNLPVLAVAAGLAGVSSVLASLVPALRLSGITPNRALRLGGSSGTSRGQHRLRSGFAMTQVALSLVLLLLSGLLLGHLHRLMHADLGFNPDAIVTETIDLSPGRYQGRDPVANFYTPLLERVQHLPGVHAAGMINLLPIEAWGSNSEVHITGQPPYPPQQEMLAGNRFVSPGYFDVFGLHLRSGRMLSQAEDRADNPSASVVVNEAFRRKFFPGGGDPVGARLDDSDKDADKTRIVGVTAGLRQELTSPSLAEMDYLVDELDPKDRLSLLASMRLVVRSEGDPKSVVPAIQQAIRQQDPTVPLHAAVTMREIVAATLVSDRMEGMLFSLFAGFALMLALIGIFSLVSHEVELRTREIGVRMALGSTRGRVVAQVLSRVSLLLAGGLACGGLLTFLLNKTLSTVMPVDAAQDGWTLFSLTFLLALAGLLAAMFPARRAASIDPNQALRSE